MNCITAIAAQGVRSRGQEVSLAGLARPASDRKRRWEMPDQHEVINGGQLVRELRLGERQAEGPLAVFPIFADADGGAGDVGVGADVDGGGEDAAPRRRL